MKLKLVCLTLAVLLAVQIASCRELVKENEVSMFVPAVEKTASGYRGVLAKLTVIVKPGSGHVFIDTLPLTEIDTQSSARLAKEAVENVLDLELDDVDLYFIIRSDSPIIGGPSAGAAMAVATIAALLNLTINQSVIMTGAIAIDGSITPVGGLLEKAEAAALHNASIFLIPEGQSMVRVAQTVEEKFPFGISIITRTKTVNLIEYAWKKWKLKVVEVRSVEDALRYVCGYTIARVMPKTEKVMPGEEMKGLASSFLNETIRMYREVSELANKTLLPIAYESHVKGAISEASSKIKDAEMLMENKSYYSASSSSFVARVKLYYASILIKLARSRDAASELENVLENLEEKLKSCELELEKREKEINSVADVELVAIAGNRLSEAKEKLREAWKSYYEGDFTSSVRQVSLSLARIDSVFAWLSLLDEFEGNLVFNASSLREAAMRRIEDARNLATYANVLGISVDRCLSLIDEAQRSYERADYAAALYDAIAARALCDALLLVSQLDEKRIEENLEKSREDALTAIAASELSGVTPIMAKSYYELAESLEDAKEKLLYYTYAKYFAKFSQMLAREMKQSEKKKEVEIVEAPVEIKTEKKSLVEARGLACFCLGFLGGFVISLLASRKRKVGRWRKKRR